MPGTTDRKIMTVTLENYDTNVVPMCLDNDSFLKIEGTDELVRFKESPTEDHQTLVSWEVFKENDPDENLVREGSVKVYSLLDGGELIDPPMFLPQLTEAWEEKMERGSEPPVGFNEDDFDDSQFDDYDPEDRLYDGMEGSAAPTSGSEPSVVVPKSFDESEGAIGHYRYQFADGKQKLEVTPELVASAINQLLDNQNQDIPSRLFEELFNNGEGPRRADTPYVENYDAFHIGQDSHSAMLLDDGRLLMVVKSGEDDKGNPEFSFRITADKNHEEVNFVIPMETETGNDGREYQILSEALIESAIGEVEDYLGVDTLSAVPAEGSYDNSGNYNRVDENRVRLENWEDAFIGENRPPIEEAKAELTDIAVSLIRYDMRMGIEPNVILATTGNPLYRTEDIMKHIDFDQIRTEVSGWVDKIIERNDGKQGAELKEGIDKNIRHVIGEYQRKIPLQAFEKNAGIENSIFNKLDIDLERGTAVDAPHAFDPDSVYSTAPTESHVISNAVGPDGQPISQPTEQTQVDPAISEGADRIVGILASDAAPSQRVEHAIDAMSYFGGLDRVDLQKEVGDRIGVDLKDIDTDERLTYVLTNALRSDEVKEKLEQFREPSKESAVESGQNQTDTDKTPKSGDNPVTYDDSKISFDVTKEQVDTKEDADRHAFSEHGYLPNGVEKAEGINTSLFLFDTSDKNDPRDQIKYQAANEDSVWENIVSKFVDPRVYPDKESFSKDFDLSSIRVEVLNNISGVDMESFGRDREMHTEQMVHISVDSRDANHTEHFLGIIDRNGSVRVDLSDIFGSSNAKALRNGVTQAEIPQFRDPITRVKNLNMLSRNIDRINDGVGKYEAAAVKGIKRKIEALKTSRDKLGVYKSAVSSEIEKAKAVSVGIAEEYRSWKGDIQTKASDSSVTGKAVFEEIKNLSVGDGERRIAAVPQLEALKARIEGSENRLSEAIEKTSSVITAFENTYSQYADRRGALHGRGFTEIDSAFQKVADTVIASGAVFGQTEMAVGSVELDAAVTLDDFSAGDLQPELRDAFIEAFNEDHKENQIHAGEDGHIYTEEGVRIDIDPDSRPEDKYNADEDRSEQKLDVTSADFSKDYEEKRADREQESRGQINSFVEDHQIDSLSAKDIAEDIIKDLPDEKAEELKEALCEYENIEYRSGITFDEISDQIDTRDRCAEEGVPYKPGITKEEVDATIEIKGVLSSGLSADEKAEKIEEIVESLPEDNQESVRDYIKEAVGINKDDPVSSESFKETVKDAIEAGSPVDSPSVDTRAGDQKTDKDEGGNSAIYGRVNVEGRVWLASWKMEELKAEAQKEAKETGGNYKDILAEKISSTLADINKTRLEIIDLGKKIDSFSLDRLDQSKHCGYKWLCSERVDKIYEIQKQGASIGEGQFIEKGVNTFEKWSAKVQWSNTNVYWTLMYAVSNKVDMGKGYTHDVARPSSMNFIGIRNYIKGCGQLFSNDVEIIGRVISDVFDPKSPQELEEKMGYTVVDGKVQAGADLPEGIYIDGDGSIAVDHSMDEKLDQATNDQSEAVEQQEGNQVTEEETGESKVDEPESSQMTSEESKEAEVTNKGQEEAKTAAEESSETKAADDESEESRVTAEGTDNGSTAEEESSESQVTSEESGESQVESEDNGESNTAAEETEESQVSAEEQEENRAAADEPEENDQVVSGETEESQVSAEESKEDQAVSDEDEESQVASEESEESDVVAEEGKEDQTAAEETGESQVSAEEQGESEVTAEESKESQVESEDDESDEVESDKDEDVSDEKETEESIESKGDDKDEATTAEETSESIEKSPEEMTAEETSGEEVESQQVADDAADETSAEVNDKPTEETEASRIDSEGEPSEKTGTGQSEEVSGEEVKENQVAESGVTESDHKAEESKEAQIDAMVNSAVPYTSKEEIADDMKNCFSPDQSTTTEDVADRIKESLVFDDDGNFSGSVGNSEGELRSAIIDAVGDACSARLNEVLSDSGADEGTIIDTLHTAGTVISEVDRAGFGEGHICDDISSVVDNISEKVDSGSFLDALTSEDNVTEGNIQGVITDILDSWIIEINPEHDVEGIRLIGEEYEMTMDGRLENVSSGEAVDTSIDEMIHNVSDVVNEFCRCDDIATNVTQAVADALYMDDVPFTKEDMQNVYQTVYNDAAGENADHTPKDITENYVHIMIDMLESIKLGTDFEMPQPADVAGDVFGQNQVDMDQTAQSVVTEADAAETENFAVDPLNETSQAEVPGEFPVDGQDQNTETAPAYEEPSLFGNPEPETPQIPVDDGMSAAPMEDTNMTLDQSDQASQELLNNSATQGSLMQDQQNQDLEQQNQNIEQMNQYEYQPPEEYRADEIPSDFRDAYNDVNGSEDGADAVEAPPEDVDVDADQED